ncbi:hypothetical protein Tco_0418642 [Tanacetum coccineum]
MLFKPHPSSLLCAYHLEKPEPDLTHHLHQPLPVAVSPTAQSPGYVPESDPEEDPEEDDEDPERIQLTPP